MAIHGDALQGEGALGGGGLGSELGRLRIAETVFGAVVLRVLTGTRPRGFKKDGILARSGSYGVLAKTSYAAKLDRSVIADFCQRRVI